MTLPYNYFVIYPTLNFKSRGFKEGMKQALVFPSCQFTLRGNCQMQGLTMIPKLTYLQHHR